MIQFVRSQFSRQDLIGRTLRFGLIGGISAVLNYSVLYLFVLLMDAPIVGNLVGFGTATGFQLVFHHHYTFSGHNNKWWKSSGAFLPSRVVVFFGHQMVFISVLPYVGQYYIMAAVAATALTMFISLIWGFVAYKRRE